MPIPVPQEGEDKNKFMGRCMVFMDNENKKKSDKNKMPQKQMVAICYTSWKDYHNAKAEMERLKRKKKREEEKERKHK